MSIPEYTIARIALHEHMRRQFDDPNHAHRHQRPTRQRPALATRTRLRLSTVLHTLATAIEPAPSQPTTMPCPQP